MTVRVRALLLVSCCVLAATTGIVAAGAASSPDLAGRTAGPDLSGATFEPSGPDEGAGNNTTVHHENPDEVDGNGDLDAVKSWLSNRMLTSLRESSVQISRGQYERGRSLVGDEYDDFLSKYVDVAGETESSTDDDTADALEETRETQREYANTVETFEETYDEYQTAKANGEDARARELARTLDSLATDLRRYNRALDDQYERVENRTGTDLSTVTGRFENVTRNVTEQAADVTAAELVTTTLAVDPEGQTASFDQPLELTGSLRVAADESAPSEATFRVAGRTQTVDVGTNGSFALTYRPQTARVGPQTLTVTYVPSSTSLFLRSNATANVTVTSVTPNVAITNATETIGFGEDVRIAGRVVGNETAVPGAVVTLSVAGERLGTTRTDDTGRFVATGRIPASVQPGDATVTVTAGREGRAIAPANASTPVSVVETPTTLSVDADDAGDELTVSGSLTAATDRAVPEQPVQIAVDGDVVATVRTSADGSYATTVERPTDADVVEIRVRFDGDGTNLESSTAQASVDSHQNGTGGGVGANGRGPTGSVTEWLSGLELGALLALIGAGVGLAALGGYLLFVRRRTDDESPTDNESVTDESTGSNDDHAVPTVADRLATMVDRPARALVRASYATLHEAVVHLGVVPANTTHWEFYRAVSENRPAVEADLRQLVETYERAVYADEPIDSATAEAARDAAMAVARTISNANTNAQTDD